MGVANCCCNVLWFIFGGFFSFLTWIVAGIFLCVTIIGIPFGLQAFKIGVFVLFPFGKDSVPSNNTLTTCQVVGNVFWIIFFGIWIAISNFFFGILCFITIIGIPFGYQFFKIAKLGLAPFGYDIVDMEYLNNNIGQTQPIVSTNNGVTVVTLKN